MAGQIENEAGAEFRRITGTGDLTHFPLMSGKVASVNEDEGSCEVELTAHGGEKSAGILFNVRLNNINGALMVPAEGASCIVGEIDGPGQLELLKASAYTKIQWMGGEKGGVPVSDKVTDRLNKVENDINNLKTVFSGWSPVPNDGGAALRLAAASWYGSELTPTTSEDIENPDIKQ